MPKHSRQYQLLATLILSILVLGCSGSPPPALLQAAEQGDTESQYNLGLMYDWGRGVKQDFAAAAKWYRLAADSPKKVKKAFEDSVDEYIAYCQEQGGQPDKPYSGSFRLRMPREVYRDVGYAAKLCDVSMNTFLVEEAEKAAKRVLRHAAKDATASAKKVD